MQQNTNIISKRTASAVDLTAVPMISLNLHQLNGLTTDLQHINNISSPDPDSNVTICSPDTQVTSTSVWVGKRYSLSEGVIHKTMANENNKTFHKLKKKKYLRSVFNDNLNFSNA